MIFDTDKLFLLFRELLPKVDMTKLPDNRLKIYD